MVEWMLPSECRLSVCKVFWLFVVVARERTEKRTISVKEARTILSNVEFSKMIGSVAKV